MKRRGFIATLFGAAAAAILPKSKPKKEKPDGYWVVSNPKIAAKLRSNYFKFYDHGEPTRSVRKASTELIEIDTIRDRKKEND